MEIATNPPQEQTGGGTINPSQSSVSTIGSSILPHLIRIFESNAGPDKKWREEQVSRFLADVQGDASADASADAATDATADATARPAIRLTPGTEQIDLRGFLTYMASSAASAQAPPPARDVDLSWPLANYFISSSHNTYLTGNQIYSDGSTDAYRNVLARGCRCVEIDVWDGDETDSESDSSDSDDGGDPVAVSEGVRDKKTMKEAKKRDKEKKTKEKKERKEEDAKGVEDDTRLGGGRTKAPKPRKQSKMDSLKGMLGKVSLGKKSTGQRRSQTASPDLQTTAKNIFIEPRVVHGYTLTKEVSFRSVCSTIRQHAFAVTDLPLIVSLEVHCSAAQQEAMVTIMKETFAGVLVDAPKTDAASTHLPAPGDLRGKILVKVKYAAPPTATDRTPGAGMTDSTDGKANEKDSDNSNNNNDDDDDDDEDDDNRIDAAGPNATKRKPSKIVQALSDMGVYTRGVSFKTLAQPETDMPTHIFSLSEKTVLDVHEQAPALLFEHNRRFMMRTYPSGMRIRSSNLDPAVFWRKGIQVVALNWQRWDEGMMLNEAMFAGTGGYILKPAGYRGPRDPRAWMQMQKQTQKQTQTQTQTQAAGWAPAQDESHTQATAVPHRMLDLAIEVMAGQDIPLPPDTSSGSFDPYVKVELHIARPGDNLLPTAPGSVTATTALSSLAGSGASGGGSGRMSAVPSSDSGRAREGEYKARTPTRKGTSPDSFGLPGETTLRFAGVPGVVDELAFVRFTVRDDEFGRDDLAAWACVRLDRLRTGYRLVSLMDVYGVATGGVLLVKVDKKLY